MVLFARPGIDVDEYGECSNASAGDVHRVADRPVMVRVTRGAHHHRPARFRRHTAPTDLRPRAGGRARELCLRQGARGHSTDYSRPRPCARPTPPGTRSCRSRGPGWCCIGHRCCRPLGSVSCCDTLPSASARKIGHHPSSTVAFTDVGSRVAGRTGSRWGPILEVSPTESSCYEMTTGPVVPVTAHRPST